MTSGKPESELGSCRKVSSLGTSLALCSGVANETNGRLWLNFHSFFREPSGLGNLASSQDDSELLGCLTSFVYFSTTHTLTVHGFVRSSARVSGTGMNQL